MEASAEQLILTIIGEIREEIRAHRTEMVAWRNDFGERLAVAETQVEDVVGNGQPGRLKRAEDAIASLTGYRYWLLGVAATIGVVAAIVGWAFPKH